MAVTLNFEMITLKAKWIPKKWTTSSIFVGVTFYSDHVPTMPSARSLTKASGIRWWSRMGSSISSTVRVMNLSFVPFIDSVNGVCHVGHVMSPTFPQWSTFLRRIWRPATCLTCAICKYAHDVRGYWSEGYLHLADRILLVGSSWHKSRPNFVSAFRGFNSTGFSGLLTFFIPLDSPWNALQLCFWVRDNQTKFSSANSRQSFSARRRHRLLTPRNSRISGRTFHLIDSDSKDLW